MPFNQGWQYQEQVQPAAVGLTLLQYYCQRYHHSTRQEWQARIEAGQVLLNGTPATADVILQAGQELTYCRPPWQEPDVPLTFEVLYADADVLAIAKPSGLPVLPGGGFLEHTLLRLLQKHYPQDSPVPIHRLGRGTSGVMLLARSPLARTSLSKQLRDRRITKIYRALMETGALPDSFTVTQPIGKIPYPGLGYVYGATSEGAFAQSHFRILERRPEAILVAVEIPTGRPHQIRIHAAVAGHPLIGDPLYVAGGVPCTTVNDVSQPVPGDCGYWLHAHTVTFHHPRTNATIQLTCAPPDILSTLEDAKCPR